MSFTFEDPVFRGLDPDLAMTPGDFSDSPHPALGNAYSSNPGLLTDRKFDSTDGINPLQGLLQASRHAPGKFDSLDSIHRLCRTSLSHRLIPAAGRMALAPEACWHACLVPHVQTRSPLLCCALWCPATLTLPSHLSLLSLDFSNIAATANLGLPPTPPTSITGAKLSPMAMVGPPKAPPITPIVAPTSGGGVGSGTTRTGGQPPGSKPQATIEKERRDRLNAAIDRLRLFFAESLGPKHLVVERACEHIQELHNYVWHTISLSNYQISFSVHRVQHPVLQVHRYFQQPGAAGPGGAPLPKGSSVSTLAEPSAKRARAGGAVACLSFLSFFAILFGGASPVAEEAGSPSPVGRHLLSYTVSGGQWVFSSLTLVLLVFSVAITTAGAALYFTNNSVAAHTQNNPVLGQSVLKNPLSKPCASYPQHGCNGASQEARKRQGLPKNTWTTY
eukprot:gene950-400_t